MAAIIGTVVAAVVLGSLGAAIYENYKSYNDYYNNDRK